VELAVPTVPGREPHQRAVDRTEIVYTYDTQSERTGITALLGALNQVGIKFRDLNTKQSSLEEIFVSLVKRNI
jgi:ABC-2 type transport system ATP-binding protein